MNKSIHLSLVGPSTRCNGGSCVEAVRNADGTVTMTSTIEGNDDSITYTGDEFDTFRQDVKDGKWDFL